MSHAGTRTLLLAFCGSVVGCGLPPAALPSPGTVTDHHFGIGASVVRSDLRHRRGVAQPDGDRCANRRIDFLFVPASEPDCDLDGQIHFLSSGRHVDVGAVGFDGESSGRGLGMLLGFRLLDQPAHRLGLQTAFGGTFALGGPSYAARVVGPLWLHATPEAGVAPGQFLFRGSAGAQVTFWNVAVGVEAGYAHRYFDGDEEHTYSYDVLHLAATLGFRLEPLAAVD